ncbi:MAG: hypothetical protein J4215_02655 [Candidatus Diapherotrites archaeon]|uniref:Uncharacterized protein n=1 Tax=Candidatus Iainarchaeum sp. TaxID=3101447 RepID=A0A8T4L3W4_9ARCH|nr:hypothetical protein [Candidatus Diapherotrites archaeon]
MVDKQVVMETIQRMRSSGISDHVIESTLQDIGLSKDEVNEYLQGGQTASTPSVSTNSSDETDDFETEDDEEPGLPQTPQSSHDEALHATTHVVLEEQSEQIQNLLEEFRSLDAKLAKISELPALQLSDSITRVENRIAGFENEINDMKTQMAAYKTIMDKLLDTNRQIVTELQERK